MNNFPELIQDTSGIRVLAWMAIAMMGFLLVIVACGGLRKKRR